MLRALLAAALLSSVVPAHAQDADIQFRWKLFGTSGSEGGETPGPGGPGGGDPLDPGDDGEPVDEDGDGMPRPYDPDDDDDGIPDNASIRPQVYTIDWMATEPWESMWQDWDHGAETFELRGARLTGGLAGTSSFVLGDTISVCFGVGGITAPQDFANVGGFTSQPGSFWIGSIQVTGWHWIREFGMDGHPMKSPAEDNGFLTFSGRDNSMCFRLKTGLNRADSMGFGPNYGQYTISVATYKEVDPSAGCQPFENFPPHTPTLWADYCLQQTGETGRSSVVGIVSPMLPGPWN